MDEHNKNKEKRIAQKILAQEITKIVHGKNASEALDSTKILFHTNINDLVFFHILLKM